MVKQGSCRLLFDAKTSPCVLCGVTRFTTWSGSVLLSNFISEIISRCLNEAVNFGLLCPYVWIASLCPVLDHFSAGAEKACRALGEGAAVMAHVD
eukprot:4146097-Amphidinium_carterae.1